MRLVSSAAFRWLLPIIWMTLIFVGSTDLLSANHTSRFIEPFLRWLFHGSLSGAGVEEIHFLIRKAGHLSEYAVLSVLFWWALSSPRKDAPTQLTCLRWYRAVLAIASAACFAASDEFHQSFIPTRTASVRDVLIDSIGAALGMLLFLAAVRFKRAMKPALQAGTANPPPTSPG